MKRPVPATWENVFDNYGKYEKYFSSMYYTSEGKVPGAKALLRFEFSLPKNPKKMRELEALLELVFHQSVQAVVALPKIRRPWIRPHFDNAIRADHDSLRINATMSSTSKPSTSNPDGVVTFVMLVVVTATGRAAALPENASGSRK